MSIITEKAIELLVPSFATCGGDQGEMFWVARSIVGSSSSDLRTLIEKTPDILAPIREDAIKKLEKEAKNGTIGPASVLRRFGHPNHYWEMEDQANRGLDSVAREIPIEIRAVAHTLLPITNGVYSNEGRIISFRGLVPLGPQDGNLVVHLGGVFSSRCTQKEIEELLREQAKDIEFLKAADKVGELNYEGTQLQRATIRAKEALGL